MLQKFSDLTIEELMTTSEIVCSSLPQVGYMTRILRQRLCYLQHFEKVNCFLPSEHLAKRFPWPGFSLYFQIDFSLLCSWSSGPNWCGRALQRQKILPNLNIFPLFIFVLPLVLRHVLLLRIRGYKLSHIGNGALLIEGGDRYRKRIVVGIITV